MGSARKPCRSISQLQSAIVGSLCSWAQMCLFVFLVPWGRIWKSTGVAFIDYFTKHLGLIYFAFSWYSETWLNRSVYVNRATEIIGGGFLCPDLTVDVLTNSLIKELALLLVDTCSCPLSPRYPWERWLYSNEHLVVRRGGPEEYSQCLQLVIIRMSHFLGYKY